MLLWRHSDFVRLFKTERKKRKQSKAYCIGHNNNNNLNMNNCLTFVYKKCISNFTNLFCSIFLISLIWSKFIFNKLYWIEKVRRFFYLFPYNINYINFHNIESYKLRRMSFRLLFSSSFSQSSQSFYIFVLFDKFISFTIPLGKLQIVKDDILTSKFTLYLDTYNYTVKNNYSIWSKKGIAL